ncbi:hypothetical protein [Thalassotalea sp. ND16A]|uniref:hypothetical protein n=1 Tax=Thalassotalea sp. ND16A TaxID=1535422 RepID=UPI00051A4182|nr:hypothetical protein [Thalassotalea sp. ND16A]KGJ88732.1 hypothetical protein ND16A_2434 [Thalassotalea sp. ND16A]
MSIKQIVFYASLVLVSSCSSQNQTENEAGDMPLQSNSWSYTPNSSEECPQINDLYHLSSESFKSQNDQYLNLGNSDINWVNLINNLDRKAKTSKFLRSNGENLNGELKVDLSKQQLLITYYGNDSQHKYVDTLDLEKLGFSCSGGKLIYPIHDFFGGGGSSAINVKVYRELFVSDDNNLVLYRQTINSKNSVHTYHIFKASKS